MKDSRRSSTSNARMATVVFPRRGKWCQLAEWLCYQKHRRSGPYHCWSQLKPDQISKLESLGVVWPNQQDEAKDDDDPTMSSQSISVATKRKATAEESESNVSHNQDDVLASPHPHHRVGACNSLNKRGRLDSSSSSNGGDTAPADGQMFACHVYAVQTDKSSQEIGIVHLSAQSTFADARQAILEGQTTSLILPAHPKWYFYVPPQGYVMESLESSLGPLRDFLRQVAPLTVTEQGDVRLFCLSTRARLDSSSSNGGDAAPAGGANVCLSRLRGPDRQVQPRNWHCLSLCSIHLC